MQALSRWGRGASQSIVGRDSRNQPTAQERLESDVRVTGWGQL